VGAVVFWDDIRDWAMGVAHDWVREHLGASAAALLTEVVVRLDRPIVAIRNRVRMVVRARVTGRGVRTVSAEDMSADDLPDDIRQQLQSGRSVEHTYSV
jgi:hypothetical protein